MKNKAYCVVYHDYYVPHWVAYNNENDARRSVPVESIIDVLYISAPSKRTAVSLAKSKYWEKNNEY